MSDADLIKLYSGRILELAASIPAVGRLEYPDASVRRRSPLCGSTVTVDVKVDGRGDLGICPGRESLRARPGRGIRGRAASRSAGRVVRSRRARDELRAMLKADGPDPSAPFEELGVLRPAREYKNRHASIMLTLEALAEAMAEAEIARGGRARLTGTKRWSA